MDTILHTVQGALITSFATDNIPIIITGGVIGALPDVVGFTEKIVKRDKKTWAWYNVVHALTLKNPLVYLPQSLLHIVQDKYTHTDTCKWWLSPCLKWEILSWIFTIIISTIKIKEML